MAQQLFAEIKKSSKYYNQNQWARNRGEFPFPVTICPSNGAYCVQGGPGGQYRLNDVDLFVDEGGVKFKISD